MALTPITVDRTGRFCALLLGPAGIGKTSTLRTLLGEDYQGGKWIKTSLRQEKVLVVSAEGGLLSVFDLVKEGLVQGFEARSLDELREIFAYIQSPAFREAGYTAVFLDSLTEISSRVAESLSKKYPNKSDTLKMWGEFSEVMTAIIKSFRDLPFASVFFTCLVQNDKDDVGKRHLAPDIAGSKLKSRLTSYFDEVFYLDRVQVNVSEDPETPVFEDRLVFKTREPVGMAKDRSGKLAAEEWPNLSLIRDKIFAA